MPSANQRKKTELAASSDPLLKKFLREYLYDNRYYDWGDDPSFFAAQELLCDIRRVSWGVCRPDVRSRLNPGDLVILFCAKPEMNHPEKWDYFYIGFGTVRATICRWRIWRGKKFQSYQRFYNVLAKPKNSALVQKETFFPFHKDWQHRLNAPYILFDENENLSHYNLTNPLHVATYENDDGPSETWHSVDCELTDRLEKLLFIERGIKRRLRSSKTGYGHQYVNLVRDKRGIIRPGRNINELRQALLELSRAIIKDGT